MVALFEPTGIAMQERVVGQSTGHALGRADHTVFAVILAISFCHLLNDMMQSLLPAIYPNLKADFGLNCGQIGMVSLVYQLTASILQPLVGVYADRRPTPLALPGGTVFSLAGLVVLSVAHSYTVLLVGASLLGVGSSVFHPESSRVARMAADGTVWPNPYFKSAAMPGRRWVPWLRHWSWCGGENRVWCSSACWRCCPARFCGMWGLGTSTTD